jgi:hypothetical protein
MVSQRGESSTAVLVSLVPALAFALQACALRIPVRVLGSHAAVLQAGEPRQRTGSPSGATGVVSPMSDWLTRSVQDLSILKL